MRRPFFKWYIAAFLAAIVILAGYRISQRTKSNNPVRAAEPAQAVEVAPVIRTDLEEVLDTGGAVLPSTEVQVTSKIPGRVAKVLVSVGQRVRAGDPLMEIESAEFASLRASLVQAEVNLADARLSFERFETLFKQQAIPRQQWEAARNRLQTAEAMYQAAREQINQAGGVAGGVNGERLVILAPESGTIARRSVDPGNLISPGVPLMSIVRISQVYVEAGVPERAVNRVKPGTEVNVRVDAVGLTRKGRVETVGPSPDSRTRTYPARIVIDNAGEELKPGMFARVSLPLGRKQGALAIRKDAVVERGGKQVVFVVADGGNERAQERVVTLGITSGELVEVLSGVSEGERVVTSGQQLLVNGARVVVSNGPAGGSRAQ